MLRISQDPIVGNGQKGTAFWERIFEHYNERRPSEFRPARSLESKWGLIKYDVSKFIGVLLQCSNLNISGAGGAHVVHKALELYRLKSAKNSEFVYMHVWELVKNVPRWNSGCTPEKTPSPTMKRKHVTSDSDCTFMEPGSSTEGGGPLASTGSRVRPQGAKHAKEDRRLATLRESESHAHANATRAMAEATVKKNQIQEDANLFLLMTHPTDSSISECAARFLRLRQEEELEKLELRLAERRALKEKDKVSVPTPIPVETPEIL